MPILELQGKRVRLFVTMAEFFQRMVHEQPPGNNWGVGPARASRGRKDYSERVVGPSTTTYGST